MNINGCTRPSAIHAYRNGTCSGCEAVPVDDSAAFERIMDLESEVRIMAAVQAFTVGGKSDYRKGQTATSLDSAKARLSGAVDALTMEQMKAFGEYRQSH